VDTTLHRGDGDIADIADDETSGVAYAVDWGKFGIFG